MVREMEIDNSEQTGEFSRRHFVKAALSTIAVTGCLSVGLKEALAQARQTGSPVFTDDSLNTLFADSRANKDLATEAAKDIRSFVRNRFTLTKIQSRRLDALSKGEIRQLTTGLNRLAKDGGPLRATSLYDAGRKIKMKVDILDDEGCLIYYN